MHVVYMTEHSNATGAPRDTDQCRKQGQVPFKTFAYPAPREHAARPGGAGAPHINPDPNSTRSSSSCFEWMFSFSYTCLIWVRVVLC